MPRRSSCDLTAIALSGCPLGADDALLSFRPFPCPAGAESWPASGCGEDDPPKPAGRRAPPKHPPSRRNRTLPCARDHSRGHGGQDARGSAGRRDRHHGERRGLHSGRRQHRGGGGAGLGPLPRLLRQLGRRAACSYPPTRAPPSRCRTTSPTARTRCGFSFATTIIRRSSRRSRPRCASHHLPALTRSLENEGSEGGRR